MILKELQKEDKAEDKRIMRNVFPTFALLSLPFVYFSLQLEIFTKSASSQTMNLMMVLLFIPFIGAGVAHTLSIKKRHIPIIQQWLDSKGISSRGVLPECVLTYFNENPVYCSELEENGKNYLYTVRKEGDDLKVERMLVDPAKIEASS